VCYSLLQYDAVFCIELQIVLLCCVGGQRGNAQLCVAVCCSVLQCVAVCCSVLQFVAVYCSVLHFVAVCCSVLQFVAVCCSGMQRVAVCCVGEQQRGNTQLCVAVSCSVLQ